MGKKKITTQSSEEVLKEKSGVESAAARAAASSKKSKKVLEGKVYINASYNNTVVTVTDNSGNVLAWGSAGLK